MTLIVIVVTVTITSTGFLGSGRDQPVTLQDIQQPWNRTIAQYDLGWRLPDISQATMEDEGSPEWELDGGGYIYMFYLPHKDNEIGLVQVNGPNDKAMEVAATAVAMTVAITDMDPHEADEFIADELLPGEPTDLDRTAFGDVTYNDIHFTFNVTDGYSHNFMATIPEE